MLYLNNNPLLTGTIPQDWVLPETLLDFELDCCNLSGPLPTGIKLPSGLQVSQPAVWTTLLKQCCVWTSCLESWSPLLAVGKTVSCGGASAPWDKLWIVLSLYPLVPRLISFDTAGYIAQDL